MARKEQSRKEGKASLKAAKTGGASLSLPIAVIAVAVVLLAVIYEPTESPGAFVRQPAVHNRVSSVPIEKRIENAALKAAAVVEGEWGGRQGRWMSKVIGVLVESHLKFHLMTLADITGSGLHDTWTLAGPDDIESSVDSLSTSKHQYDHWTLKILQAGLLPDAKEASQQSSQQAELDAWAAQIEGQEFKSEAEREEAVQALATLRESMQVQQATQQHLGEISDAAPLPDHLLVVKAARGESGENGRGEGSGKGSVHHKQPDAS